MKRKIGFTLLLVVLINFALSFFIPADVYYDCLVQQKRTTRVFASSMRLDKTIYVPNEFIEDFIKDKYPTVSPIIVDKSALDSIASSNQRGFYFAIDINNYFLFNSVKLTNETFRNSMFPRYQEINRHFFINIGTHPICLPFIVLGF